MFFYVQDQRRNLSVRNSPGRHQDLKDHGRTISLVRCDESRALQSHSQSRGCLVRPSCRPDSPERNPSHSNHLGATPSIYRALCPQVSGPSLNRLWSAESMQGIFDLTAILYHGSHYNFARRPELCIPPRNKFGRTRSKRTG